VVQAKAQSQEIEDVYPPVSKHVAILIFDVINHMGELKVIIRTSLPCFWTWCCMAKSHNCPFALQLLPDTVEALCPGLRKKVVSNTSAEEPEAAAIHAAFELYKHDFATFLVRC
jgi:hypothetical protein